MSSGLFYSLATVNSAAINIGVQMSLLYPELHSFRYMPRSGITGLYGSSLSPLLLNIALDFLAREIRQEQEKKMDSNRGGKIKPFLFADNMILYLKDPKNSTKKLLEIINTFGKVAVYKINIQKSVIFLYTNNE
jgi:hypothetical protein